MDSQKQQEYIALIKKKTELSGVSDTVIARMLSQKNVVPQTPAEVKLLIKEVRAELRELLGRFQQSQAKREQLLSRGNIDELLKSHASTAERLPYYSVLKEKISELSIKSILDLGCGLNPLALASRKVFYYAADIQEDELQLIQTHFQREKISGTTFVYDLRFPEDQKPLPEADLCLLFKVVDLLDKRGHKNAEQLLKAIHARYLLISFSTKTLSGKPMNHPQRGWIEWLLQRLGYTFTTFTVPNEFFYLAEKTASQKS